MATQSVAVVTIDHQSFLMPRAKALKVAELMGDAVVCNWDIGRGYSGGEKTFVCEQPARISIEFIEPHQVELNGANISPTRRKTRKALPETV